LWIDSDERHAGGNLRSALWRLRSTRDEVVHATSTHVRLSPDVRVDLDDATHLSNALTRPNAPVDIASVDSRILAFDVLPDWYDDWVIFERERFRQMRLHALESLCERQVSMHLHAEAVQSGLAAVNADPLRESAHRALIKAYLAERNYAEAQRQYRALADLLMTDLGIEPSEEAAKLMQVTVR
jgi:DNA-binding SARP family transcriptional activator